MIRSLPHRIAWLVFGSVWLVYITTAGGSLGTSDAVAMYEVAVSILDRGQTDVPEHQSLEPWRGVDGRYYSPLGIGQPLFDVPFVLIGRVIQETTGIRLAGPDTIPKAVVAMASTLPAAATVAFCFLLAWRLSRHLRASLVAAAALAFGTLLWPYSKFGFNAALTAGMLAGGVYGFIAGAERARPAWLLASGSAIGYALLTRHEMALAGVVCLLWLWWQVRTHPSKIRMFSAGATGVICGIAVSLALNWLRFGSPFQPGHTPAITFAGLTAFLTSPSGAIWLYAPPALAVLALIPLLRRRDPAAALLAAVVSAMVLFYVSLDDWLGTRSYGPRYLVPLLSLMVAPLALWIASARRGAQQWGLAALCTIGVIAQLPGVIVDFSRVGIAAGQPPQIERRDDWRWAAIRLNANAALEAVPRNIQYVSGLAPVPAVTRDARVSPADLAPHSLDFWWLYLFYLGILPRVGLLLCVAAPLTAASWLAAVAWRHAAVRPRN